MRSMKVAFCGLGLMGTAMVRRLLVAGHKVTVWNRSAQKASVLVDAGARVVPTPSQAADDADAVLVCVRDGAAVESVVFGAGGLHEARGLKWVADHSSIAPEFTRDLARRLKQACGADWIDAPVSGGVNGVEAGTLAIMAGGPEAAIAEASRVMASYAGRVTRMGDVGTGQATKLCNQTIVATTVLAIAEAVSFAQRNGIDATRLPDALAGGWADSSPLRVFVPRMARAHEQSIGTLSTMLKDVETVAATAQRSGLPMPVAGNVLQVLRVAAAMGLGDAELSSVICVLQPERCGEFLPQAQR